jgi:hypothetical protein
MGKGHVVVGLPKLRGVAGLKERLHGAHGIPISSHYNTSTLNAPHPSPLLLTYQLIQTSNLY